MHLQYILSCSLCHSAVKSYGIWNRTHQWETGCSLFSPVTTGPGRLYHALQPPCCCVTQQDAECCAGFPVGACKGKTASKEWEIGGVSPWPGADLHQVLHRKREYFQALWRQRRIPKMKKTSLGIQAKCCLACEGLGHWLGVWELSLWTKETCNSVQSILLLVTKAESCVSWTVGFRVLLRTG